MKVSPCCALKKESLKTCGFTGSSSSSQIYIFFCLDQPVFYNVIDSYLFAAYLCDFSLCWIASESINIMLYFNKKKKSNQRFASILLEHLLIFLRYSQTDVLCHHLPHQLLQRGGGCWQPTSPAPEKLLPASPSSLHSCPPQRACFLASEVSVILFCRTIKLSSYAGEVCLWDGGWHWELSWSRRKTSRLKMEHCCVGSHQEMRQMHSPSL